MTSMIEFASPENFPEAIRIWTTCFGDTEQYARFLFDRLLAPNDVLFHRNDAGHPDAMLCVKPFRLATPDEAVDGAYIFGVATLPESRARGIASALLDEAHLRLSARGVAATVLVPAGSRLFDFYAKRGYKTAFSVCRVVCADLPLETPKIVLKPARLEEFHKFRRRHYAGRRLFVDWDDAWLRYVDAEAGALGGGTWTWSDDRSGYVVCYPYRNLVIVKELAAPESCIGEVLDALHEKFPASEYRFHLPEDAAFDLPLPLTSRIEPFAMLHWLDTDTRSRCVTKTGGLSYMAHVLDGPTLGVPLSD